MQRLDSSLEPFSGAQHLLVPDHEADGGSGLGERVDLDSQLPDVIITVVVVAVDEPSLHSATRAYQLDERLVLLLVAAVLALRSTPPPLARRCEELLQDNSCQGAGRTHGSFSPGHKRQCGRLLGGAKEATRWLLVVAAGLRPGATVRVVASPPLDVLPSPDGPALEPGHRHGEVVSSCQTTHLNGAHAQDVCGLRGAG